MKKIFLLFIVMFTALGFVACNQTTNPDNTGTAEVTTEVFEEQIDYPKNLEINAKILSWDEVTGAVGYYVYLDGEEVAEVSTNSYDFSALTGDRLIFTVVANAPTGMLDSEESTSLAYVADPEGELAAMKLSAQSRDIEVSDEFLEELVNKGMLATEFDDMMDSMDQLELAMQSSQDMNSAFTALDTFVEDMDNIEAIISAAVKYLLPEELNRQITYIQQDIAYYQQQIDDGYDYWGDYQDYIDELNEEIAQIEAMLDMLDTSSDDIVKSALIVVEYILSVEELVTDDLITKISNLSETQSLETLDVNALVLVKDEIVNILTTTMPEYTDVLIVVNTGYAIVSTLTENEEFTMPELYQPEKIAGTMVLTFEAFLQFVDNFDTLFFTQIQAIGTSAASEYRIQAEIMTLVITYVDNFLEENEALLQEISDVYTEDEKEAMFLQYKATLEAELAASEVALDLSFFTFDKLMALQIIFDEALNDALDAFVASEGEILMIAAEMQEYDDEFWMNYDSYTSDYDEHNYNMMIYQMKIIDQVMYLLNSVASEKSQADFENVREIIFEIAKISLSDSMMEAPTPEEEQMIDDLLDAVETFLTTTTEEEYEIIQSLLAYLDEEDVFLDFALAYEIKYDNDYAAIHTEEHGYFVFAFAMNNYDAYMTTENEANFDAILAAMVILFEEDIFVDNNMTEVPTIASDLFDYINTISAEVAGFDYANLTLANIGRIQEIMTEIDNIVTQNPTA